MRAGDLCQSILVHVVSTQCRCEVVEVPAHRRGKIEVERPARNIPDPEPVPNAEWDEDERPSRTGELTVFEIHHVLALEDVERLRGIVMYMNRRTKSRRLLRLQDGDNASRCVGVRLDRHPEVAEVDESSCAWPDDKRSLQTRHDWPEAFTIRSACQHRSGRVIVARWVGSRFAPLRK